jgi:hypothetical protein
LTQTYAVLDKNLAIDPRRSNEPVVIVDHPYRVIYRDEGDLAAVACARDEYTASSRTSIQDYGRPALRQAD